MTLTQAMEVARNVMAEHGGIELQIANTRPRMVPVNPDNDAQRECADAWNVLAATTFAVAGIKSAA